MTLARIETVEALRALYPEVGQRAAQKILPRLEKHSRAFITLSPFLLLSSMSKAGRADVSPRGGKPGFVEIIDDGTLAIPDWPGNNRLDSFANIVENPSLSAIFLIPGVEETLRIVGHGEIRTDGELLTRFVEKGRMPRSVLLIRLEEVFLHCAKAILRANLWDEGAKVERSTLPSMGRMIFDQIGCKDEPEPQSDMIARYRDTLY